MYKYVYWLAQLLKFLFIIDFFRVQACNTLKTCSHGWKWWLSMKRHSLHYSGYIEHGYAATRKSTILILSQTRAFWLSTCKVYASHWKYSRSKGAFLWKVTLAFFWHRTLPCKKVTDWLICQRLCMARYLQCGQLPYNILKTCSPCCKFLIGYEKVLSSL